MFIVAIEGLRSSADQIIVKELAIVHQDGVWVEPVFHGFFKPPHSKSQLSPKAARSNAFVTEVLHGVDWCEGRYPYTSIAFFLGRHIPEGVIVGVKGDENARLIASMITNSVVDLHEIGAPSFRHRSSDDRELTPCGGHSVRRNATLDCALKKALFFGFWVSEQALENICLLCLDDPFWSSHVCA